MKKPSLLAFLLCIVLHARAATNITTPTVSGHWTLAGSPYIVLNDITIDIGDVLVIDPGVQVVFDGFYNLYVSGSIQAVGTASAHITFAARDTIGWSNFSGTQGAWRGIEIWDYLPHMDSVALEYCDFRDTKGFAALGIYGRLRSIANCNFTHNNYTIVVATDSNMNFEMAHCNIYDNIADTGNMVVFAGYTYVDGSFTSCNIHDCNIYNNSSPITIAEIFNINCVFRNNKVYSNKQTSLGVATIVGFGWANALISGNYIYDNTSQCQGALSLEYCNADIDRNYVCNNQSLKGSDGSSTCGHVQGGGGIRLYADTTIYHVVRNNIIANNYAAYSGGAIYGFHARARVLNNHIINNESPNGEAISIFNNLLQPNLSFDIKNNIFYNNKNSLTGATRNIAMSGDPTATISFEHNWSQLHFSSEALSVPPGSILGDTSSNVTGNNPGIQAPPLSSGVATSAWGANFSLLATSPCVDQGDTTGIGSIIGSVDYLSASRITGIRIDIGACEYSAATVGTTEMHQQQTQVTAYPNPAANVLFINTPTAQGNISIFDAYGKEVLVHAATNTTTFFNVANLPRGVYFAQWNDGQSKPQTKKVIIE